MNPPNRKEREAAYRTMTSPRHVRAMISRVFRRTVIRKAPPSIQRQITILARMRPWFLLATMCPSCRPDSFTKWLSGCGLRSPERRFSDGRRDCRSKRGVAALNGTESVSGLLTSRPLNLISRPVPIYFWALYLESTGEYIVAPGWCVFSYSAMRLAFFSVRPISSSPSSRMCLRNSSTSKW